MVPALPPLAQWNSTESMIVLVASDGRWEVFKRVTWLSCEEVGLISKDIIFYNHNHNPKITDRIVDEVGEGLTSNRAGYRIKLAEQADINWSSLIDTGTYSTGKTGLGRV